LDATYDKEMEQEISKVPGLMQKYEKAKRNLMLERVRSIGLTPAPQE